MTEHDYAAALAGLPRRRDQLLPALHTVQAAAGWLPEAAIEAAARHVFVPLSEVYGIVTGYSELRLTEPNAERVEVCTGLSCRMAGADGLIDALPAGTHVERVPCRFLCAVAPVAEVHSAHPHDARTAAGGAYAGRLTAGTVRHLARPAVRGAGVPQCERPTLRYPRTLAEKRAASAEYLRRRDAEAVIAVADSLCARSAGAGAIQAALEAALQAAELRERVSAAISSTGCDGACHAQPVVSVRHPNGGVTRFERMTPDRTAEVIAAARSNPTPTPPPPGRRVLRRVGVIDPDSIEEALVAGAYAGLERALAMAPDEVVELVRASGLRGRGGAYFPVAAKWDSARGFPAPRYLVVNAEEGEPGVFKDRHLMEGDPHALVEGTLIAAYALGAAKAFLYVNGQAELSAERIARAVADARAAGLAGEDILGSGFSCELAIYRGAGGYVCGEESVILNSIEGERAVPRLRPPFPTEAGLWRQPTVINNVETLVNLPLILTEGAEWFRAVGTEAFPGTKLMSLSGALAQPGLVEVPMGATIRHILEEAGGGPLPGHTITAAVVGGPSGGLMPASMFDTSVGGGMLHPSGPVLGAGGIVVLDERTPLAFALRELTAYNREESCGKCTPCREGTARALAILDRTGAGPLAAEDRDELLELSDLLQTASLCGLGQMAPGPIRSALTLFDLTP